MSDRHGSSGLVSGRARTVFVHCVLLLCGLTLVGPASAQTSVRERTSLRFIPDDAAFYSTSLRLKEQYESFTRSKAFTRLCALPYVKLAAEELKKSFEEGFLEAEEEEDDDDEKNGEKKEAGAKDAQTDPRESLREFYAFWGDLATQKLTALGLDALSHEVFFYGDKSTMGFLREIQKLNREVNRLTLAGERGPFVNTNIQPLLDHLDKLPVPAFVMGFKTTDSAGITEQITALETWLKSELDEYPKVLEGLRREKIGESEFLTLALKGSQIPWEELLKEAEEEGEGDDDDDEGGDPRPVIEALEARLKDRTLTISIGVTEGYLFVSFGETNSHLAKMFEKGKRLADRPEMAPLLKSPEVPLTSISYTSPEVMERLHDSSDVVEGLKEGLGQFGPLLGFDEEASKKLLDDVQELMQEGAAFVPKPGAVLNWSFATPRGYESFTYQFGGGNRSLDGSKPLTILEHVGSSPLIVTADRLQNQVASYQYTAKALRVAGVHLDRTITMYAPAPYDQLYAQFKEEFQPILQRFHEITADELLPALADGQSAFVLESQPLLIGAIPQRETKPLPVPLPALVYGVSDADLLQKACGNYFGLLQKTVMALSRVSQGQIPPFILPPPTARTVGEARLHVYPIAGNEGDEGEIAATGGLTKTFAVLSLAPAQAKRLLDNGKLAPAGVLQRADRPTARVWYFNMAGIIDMIRPWGDVALESSAAELSPEDLAAATETVKGVLDFISCFRSAAGVQYVEDGVLIHHYESVYEDLK